MPANPWDDIAPMAPGDVMIHIGPPKTGSTSIQTTMAERRDEMAGLGVLYPGSGVRAKFSGWAVMGARPRGMRKPRMSEWDELVREVNDSGLKAVVSSEAFGRADEDAIGRMVESFGAERVHVVAVGRRLDKALPSLYQEKVKKFLSTTYEEWLADILAGDDLDSIAESFPPGQQLALTARKWAVHLDPQRFHLICSDEKNRALMPRSFERLLDLPDGFLEPGTSANESLDRTSVEMLRQLNAQKKAHGWTDDFYRKMVFYGAVKGLRHREWGPEDTKVPTPPEWALSRIRTLADHTIASLAEQRVHVIGDLGSLRPGEDVAAPASPLVESTTVPMDAAVAALAGVVDAAWQLEEGRSKRRAEARRGGEGGGQRGGKAGKGKRRPAPAAE